MSTSITASDVPHVVQELRETFDEQLVAYVTGVDDTHPIRTWADGTAAPSFRSERVLRLARRLSTMFADAGAQDSLLEWIQARNPVLSDRTPAEALREGDLDSDSPLILAAASRFAGEHDAM